MKGKLLLITAFSFAFIGCAPTTSSGPANIASSGLEIEPSIKTYLNPENNALITAKSFTIIPAGSIYKKTSLTGILEKQVLFQARNFLEAKGYIFVEPSSSPDLVVVLDGTHEYKESYIPPSSYSLPVYVPGKTSTTYNNYNGYLNTYGSGNSGYGSYYGQATTTSQSPGYYTTQQYNTSGYNMGRYYPAYVLKILDKSFKDVFDANGVGTSRNPDLAVGGQSVLLQMIKALPRTVSDLDKIIPVIGADFFIWTADGNTFYPIVRYIEETSKVALSGVQYADFVVAVDDVTTRNITYNKFMSLISSKKNISLTLLRGKETIKANIQL